VIDRKGISEPDELGFVDPDFLNPNVFLTFDKETLAPAEKKTPESIKLPQVSD